MQYSVIIDGKVEKSNLRSYTDARYAILAFFDYHAQSIVMQPITTEGLWEFVIVGEDSKAYDVSIKLDM